MNLPHDSLPIEFPYTFNSLDEIYRFYFSRHPVFVESINAIISLCS